MALLDGVLCSLGFRPPLLLDENRTGIDVAFTGLYFTSKCQFGACPQLGLPVRVLL